MRQLPAEKRATSQRVSRSAQVEPSSTAVLQADLAEQRLTEETPIFPASNTSRFDWRPPNTRHSLLMDPGSTRAATRAAFDRIERASQVRELLPSSSGDDLDWLGQETANFNLPETYSRDYLTPPRRPQF